MLCCCMTLNREGTELVECCLLSVQHKYAQKVEHKCGGRMVEHCELLCVRKTIVMI